jgi:predicted TPR repeat methyltransferase
MKTTTSQKVAHTSGGPRFDPEFLLCNTLLLTMVPVNSLDLARSSFIEGIGHFEAERFSQAHASFSLALEHAPGRPSIVLNLGVTLVRLRRFEEAIPTLEKALGLDETSIDGWAALALALSEVSLWARCVQACEKLFLLESKQVSAHLLHARSLANIGRLDDAKIAYGKALQLDKQCAQAWYQLADVQRQQGDSNNAIENYQQALAHGADPELVNYMLAALNKTAAVMQPPRAYVQDLFDQYANDFEQHLVGQLGYCGHTVLVEQLPTTCPSHFSSVLDLGCGTGLCAALLRLKSTHLTGIDLSPAMIEKSRKTGWYDHLVASDAHDYLERETMKFDLVVAADVFIYIGELERLFSLLAERMAIGGWLAFTVELANDGSALQLLPSLRYAHSVEYIQGLAQRHGFSLDSHKLAPIRVHQGVPLMGQYWYLRLA